MRIISHRRTRTRKAGHRGARLRATDARVVRSRAALSEAARTLFLRQGYAGTTMEEIAELAGVTRRTAYNNYADKDALFTEIVLDTIGFAEAYARGVRKEFTAGITAANVAHTLRDLGRRLALTIVRPEVVSLRRLLVSEGRAFPALAARYFDHAPGQVMEALSAGFAQLGRKRLLRVTNTRRAAAQFAYLVAGEPLDRAILVGTMPSRAFITECAREGVETFLARYAGTVRRP